ncbi:splicing factor 18 [Seminavis robusta]|uniref:Splicing factor 18 n=1 Tax=Seminavis robusta TaxID=568900 RepID=A0A9N8DPI8_9STRA|nr:splicing factor 18 [Seminavis robusta]|eukprot:Sro194_g083050.1 splicing factor 18 (279) ;mRNA; r:87465-88390
MDLLKRELERKKKTVEKAKATSGGRRFFRAGDLRRQEEEEEEEKQAKYAASRKKRKLGSDQDDDEHTTTAALGSKKKKDKGSQKAKESETQEKESSVSKKSQSESNEAVRLSSDEITKKLRAFGLPIKLFGESLEDRVKRLRKALDEQRKAQAGDAEMDEFRLGRGHGIRNTFLGKDKDDTAGAGEQAHVEETDAAKDDKETETKDDDDDLGDDSDPHKRVYKYFKGLLRGGKTISCWPDSVKRSVAGRNETKTLKQCKDYIRPMFKLLKSRRMDESI